MAAKKQDEKSQQEVPATPEDQREALLADLLEKKKVFEDAQVKYQEFVVENPDAGTKQASLAEIRALMAKKDKTVKKQEAE